MLAWLVTHEFLCAQELCKEQQERLQRLDEKMQANCLGLRLGLGLGGRDDAGKHTHAHTETRDEKMQAGTVAAGM